jgi:hypothetical protein
MKPVINLSPWEYEWACHVGARRFAANWFRPDAKHYNKERMEDQRTAEVAACAAELAVAKYANRYWSGHVWDYRDHNQYKEMPDVGTNIEVRRLRTEERAAVRKRQVGKKLILFVAKPIMPEIRSVEIYGWIPYDKAWEFGVPSDYDQDTRLISPDMLHPELPYDP